MTIKIKKYNYKSLLANRLNCNSLYFLLILYVILLSGCKTPVSNEVDQIASHKNDSFKIYRQMKFPEHFSLFMRRNNIFSSSFYADKAEINKKLLESVKEGKFYDTKQLLEEDLADTNTIDKDGNTPLIIAAKKNEYIFITMLIDYGADVDIKNNNGKTALDIAIDKNYYSIADTLKE